MKRCLRLRRSSVVVLTLVISAALSLSTIGRAAAQTSLLPGKIELTIPSTGSTQNLVSSAVTAVLCPAALPTTRDPRIILASDGGGSTPRWDELARGLVLSLDTGAPSVPANLAVHATEISLIDSQAIVLECGTFTQKLLLDPSVNQPSGTLALSRSIATLTLPLAVLRRFTRQSDGAILDVPANLQISVSGPYAVATPNGSADSNVLLFAALVNGAWTPVESCGQEILLGGYPCLKAGTAWLEAATPPNR